MKPTFLGPQAEHSDYLKRLIARIIDAHRDSRASRFPEDKRIQAGLPPAHDPLYEELEKLLRLMHKETPFYHPRYLAHMLSEPSLSAILGYFTFLLTNPNNTTFEAGPVTTELEIAVEKEFLALLEWKEGWGHLTSGGTIANLEALWIARESRAKGVVAFSEASHFGWKNVSSVVGSAFRVIPVDRHFRIDLQKLEDLLKKEAVSFVVANIGSTGTGSVDNIQELLALRNKYPFHLHVDAAYGGFFRTLLRQENGQFAAKAPGLSDFVSDQLRAMRHCDSVTIDPHKHGLVSYGAGAIFYRDHALKSKILHTSPYTYHVKTEANIGMYSLEGSRPGAAAAACYLTYRMFPLHRSGLGSILEGCLKSTQTFVSSLEATKAFTVVTPPDLDIVCFSRTPVPNARMNELNGENRRLLDSFSVQNPSARFFVSKFSVGPAISKLFLPALPNADGQSMDLLRCVFMKDLSCPSGLKYLEEFVQTLKDAVKA